MATERIYNFSPGPATLPLEVLERAASEMTNYRGSGMSVMEMSHRSKVYEEIINDARERLCAVLGIPENYKVLFMQSGATHQFSMVAMNLLPRTGRADYALTGDFATKAYKEAGKFGTINIAGSSKDRKFAYIPQQDALTLDPGASYFHYCMNNTIYGSLWNYIPDTGEVPLVTDASSCILSEPLDVSRFGLIYAGAQKNMGISGLTVAIVREDLIGSAPENTPIMLDYRTYADNDSLYNTPPCYSIYIMGLALEWIENTGGLAAMQKHNREKAAIVYDVLDNSKLYKGFIDKPYRSMMNITFTTGSEELDEKFVKASVAAGMTNLKGHRAQGAMRASMYNAMSREGAEHLAKFMREFEKTTLKGLYYDVQNKNAQQN